MDITNVKRVLIGQPFPNSQEIHERLDRVRGLAVFASDPISSNAYATEAIMSVLVVLGSGALRLTLPLALAVAALVLLVVFSYIQTIMHYQQGGGAYMVSKDNLGRYPSLVAAAALLSDYVLTVSVSVSAGVRAVTSALPEAYDYRVIIALGAIGFITRMNLRGARESATVFAIPTYAFVGGVLLVILIGILRKLELLGVAPLPDLHGTIEAEKDLAGLAYIWLLLRAFAGGCTALTGIEAISDGVQAFKPPRSRNAASTMVAMGVIAMTLFIGIAFLATTMHLVPTEHGERILRITRQITGGGLLYYWVQVFTALILFLAANTGFQDFAPEFVPGSRRLHAALDAEPGRPAGVQLRHLVLAAISSLIVIGVPRERNRHAAAVRAGVMLGFTLSQAGMCA